MGLSTSEEIEILLRALKKNLYPGSRLGIVREIIAKGGVKHLCNLIRAEKHSEVGVSLLSCVAHWVGSSTFNPREGKRLQQLIRTLVKDYQVPGKAIGPIAEISGQLQDDTIIKPLVERGLINEGEAKVLSENINSAWGARLLERLREELEKAKSLERDSFGKSWLNIISGAYNKAY